MTNTEKFDMVNDLLTEIQCKQPCYKNGNFTGNCGHGPHPRPGEGAGGAAPHRRGPGRDGRGGRAHHPRHQAQRLLARRPVLL